MSVQVPAVPNYGAQIADSNQSPLDMYGKVLQLKSLMGQQQLLPYQLQEQQERAKQEQLKTQQMQIEQASQDAMIKAWSDPDFVKSFSGPDAANRDIGFDPDGMAKALISRKVLPKDALAMSNTFLERSKNIAEIVKTNAQAGEAQQNVRDKTLTSVADKIGSIQNLAPEKQAAALDQFHQDLAKNPGAFKGLTQQELQELAASDATHLDALGGLIGFEKKLNEFHEARFNEQKADLSVAPPSIDRVTTFTTKTVPSFSSLRPEQKAAFISEAQSARTVDELNKVVERADATDKAEQMHADSMAMAEAMKSQGFAQKGIGDNDKLWTDPQHGYLTLKSQIDATLNGLQAGVAGNGLAASMAPTMVVLGVNGFNQTHRISPAEAQAAGMPGGYAERFNAWADKAFTGKLSAQVAAEGRELLNSLKDAAYERTLNGSKLISQSHQVPNISVFDKNGNLTTLDKLSPAGGGGFDWSKFPEHK